MAYSNLSAKVKGWSVFTAQHGGLAGAAMDLIGGAANWHPPGSTFTVHIEDDAHPTTQGVEDFDVEDEIYISAHDPHIHILASAEWFGKAHPMAWVKSLRFRTRFLHHFRPRSWDL